MICIQCGAPITINTAQKTAICEYCGASITTSDFEVLNSFQTDYNRYEMAERKRLKQESIHMSFLGKICGGRDKDVDEVELAYSMADFIMSYPLPENKDAFLKFYLFANNCANKGNWNDDLFDTDEILIKAWKGKVSEIENTIDILYSQDPDIKKIKPLSRKRFRFGLKK